MKFTTRFAIMAAAVLFAGAAAFAADSEVGEKKYIVILRSGMVLEDAYILDKKPNGITIAHKNGCMFVNFSDMPREFQQKFGYDPIKSALYEREMDERKWAFEKEEEKQNARQKKLREDDKHYKDKRISTQQQKVRKLELELAEAQKRLDSSEKTIGDDHSSPDISSIGSTQVCIESPWGYGGRIKSGTHNAAVTNKLMKEASTSSAKRDSQVQSVIDLQLKLEAAQETLDLLLLSK